MISALEIPGTRKEKIQSMASLPDFGDDEIFYGSVPTTLARVPGRAVPYLGAEAYMPDIERDAETGLPSRSISGIYASAPR